jgi:uncharacterized protein YprB with RNaseH-like and TPR domain
LAGNLRDRLKRIQQQKQAEHTAHRADSAACGIDLSPFTGRGWVPAGHLTLRREIDCGVGFTLPHTMPEAAGLVMPGMCGATAYEDLLFFDLETTGLSTGAGTIAFLAAFGRLTAAGELRITQYLLLDYPGESNFIEALLGEFNRADITMVSYNGKCFDSQILSSRCLMNRIIPPEYRHADLLHPARRLWKRLLPDCSQATIETGVLGIDRTGDIPGAMAPEIWFEFLKSGEAGPLLAICEHNRRDIAGLASIFSAMIHLADDPFSAKRNINFDFETFSIRWYEITHCRKRNYRREFSEDPRLGDMGERLLRHAAEMACPRAELYYGLVVLRAKHYDEGREWLYRAAAAGDPPIQAAALRALAIDSEHRLKNIPEALELAGRGMALLPPDSSRREEFALRIQRLRLK